MSVRIAKPEHEMLYQDLVALIKKSTDEYNLTSEELLAVASNMLGKIIALQDQRTMTRERALKIVIANLEFGNHTVINELAAGVKGNA